MTNKFSCQHRVTNSKFIRLVRTFIDPQLVTTTIHVTPPMQLQRLIINSKVYPIITVFCYGYITTILRIGIEHHVWQTSL